MSPIWWSFALFGIGLLLIAIDVVVPSGGALAVLSVVTFATSIAVAFSESLQAGILVLVGETLFLSVIAAMLVKWWPHSPLGKRILIQRHRVDVAEPAVPEMGLKHLIGMVGVTKSKMLPAGSIVIAGQRYDAITEGSAIEAGMMIEVVSVDMKKIKVRPTDRAATPTTNPDRSPGDDLLSRPIEELGFESFEDPLS